MSVHVTDRVWRELGDRKGSELLLLLALADNANDEGVAWPSQETLAAKTRMSDRQVRRLVKALTAEEAPVLKTETRRWNGSPHVVYTILLPPGHFVPDKEDHPDISVNHPDIAVSGEPSLEPSQDLTPPPASPSKQERDNVWDALEAIFGKPTTPQHRKRFGKVQRELLADTSLTATAVAGEVGMRAARYRTKWPGCELTLEALAKHWPDLRNGNGAANGHGHEAEIPDVVLTVEDYREWKRTASPMQDALYQQRFDLAGDGLPA